MNRIVPIIVSFLVVVSATTRATTPEYLDSVKQVLNTTDNKLSRLNCLYTLSFEYGLIDPRKGIAYGRECLELATREKHLHYQLNAYNGIANAYETLGKFDSAHYFHQQSYEIAKKMKAPDQVALTLFNVGLCLKQLGEYKNALDQYLVAYKILEKQTSYNPRIHFYLGEMYLKTGDYVNAEHQSKLGIEKCIAFKQDYVIYNMYVNLARCYMHRGETDLAIGLLDTTLAGLKRNTDKWSTGICLNALGEAYVRKKNYQKAMDVFSDELALQKEIKNDNGIYMAYLNMANCAAHLKNRNKMQIRNLLQNAEQQFAVIKKNNDILSDAYYKAAQTYELIADKEKALQYYKSYFVVKDSLLNREKFQQLNELQTRYETEKKENVIRELKQADRIKTLELDSKDKEIKKRNILIGLGFLSLALIAVLVYFFIQKQRYKNTLEKEMAIKHTEETERLRIAKDIHDDLGSGLSKINFLSELISRDRNLHSQSAENAEAISETSKKLVVNMRDLIWALNPENTTLAGLVSRIREHSSDYLEDFSADLKLDFPEAVDAAPITKESHRQVLMTIKESLNNIVKHSKATLVEIETRITESVISFTVKDNGVGLADNNGTGNGLGNMKARIESIGGVFSINRNVPEGTMITLIIPIDNMKRS